MIAFLALALFAGTPVQSKQAAPAIQAAVTVLPDKTYHHALVEDIRSAKKEIRAAFYLVNPSDSKNNRPTQILRELISAHQRGVDVSVLFELSEHNKEVNRANAQAAALLSEKGVPVSFDAPGTTTHTKLMVIDRRICFVGSHNLTQAALTKNRELSLRIDNPQLADQLIRYIKDIR